MAVKEEKNGAHILNQDTTRSSNKKMISLIEKKYENN